MEIFIFIRLRIQTPSFSLMFCTKTTRLENGGCQVVSSPNRGIKGDRTSNAGPSLITV